MTPITAAQAINATVNGVSVALFLHGGDEYASDARRLGRRRSGDPGEEHRDEHADVSQAAGQVSHQRARQSDQLFGDAGRVHQVCGQHEEGNRQQEKRVVRLQHLVEEKERRQAIVDEKYRDAGETQRKRDRDAEDDEGREDAEQNGGDVYRAHDPLANSFTSSRIFSARKRSQQAPAKGHATWIESMLMPVISELCS